MDASGYDESTRGSGYEDIDLRNRFRALRGYTVVNAFNTQWRKFSAGWSFPTTPAETRRRA